MGKKSRKTTKVEGSASLTSKNANANASRDKSKNPLGANEIPLYRNYQPQFFKTLVNEINQVQRFDAGLTWVCFDDDCAVAPTIDESTGTMAPKRIKLREVGKPSQCPVCFEPASEKCARCESVFYCGAACQKEHWKQCHKKGCKPNPSIYHFDISMDQFRALPSNAFVGHEFIVIKPTERLNSLAEICDLCLESADDIFDKVDGFGNDQIQPQWALNNGSSSPIAKRLRNHFGWTSYTYEVGTLEGYRHSEDHFVFMLMYDDNFLNEMRMAPSYYGDACFPWAREGKHVRGNLVIFKLYIKNKKRVPKPKGSIVIACSDDSDLQHEYELYPITKAEVGHILQERRKAIEKGKYTRRQWRFQTRAEERRFEMGNMLDFALPMG